MNTLRICVGLKKEREPCIPNTSSRKEEKMKKWKPLISIKNNEENYKGGQRKWDQTYRANKPEEASLWSKTLQFSSKSALGLHFFLHFHYKYNVFPFFPCFPPFWLLPPSVRGVSGPGYTWPLRPAPWRLKEEKKEKREKHYIHNGNGGKNKDW